MSMVIIFIEFYVLARFHFRFKLFVARQMHRYSPRKRVSEREKESQRDSERLMNAQPGHMSKRT